MSAPEARQNENVVCVRQQRGNHQRAIVWLCGLSCDVSCTHLVPCRRFVLRSGRRQVARDPSRVQYTPASLFTTVRRMNRDWKMECESTVARRAPCAVACRDLSIAGARSASREAASWSLPFPSCHPRASTKKNRSLEGECT